MSGRGLTPSQAGAVEHGRGDACVLAGAGSGKTTVLTERYVALARRPGADVRRIAALTFTEKAASEMRERIAAAFAAAPDLASRARDVEFAPISTIHAYCARLLREHAIEAALDPAFELLDESGAMLLREDVWSALEHKLRRRGDVRLAVLRRLGNESAWRDVLRLYDRRRGLARPPASGGLLAGGPGLDAALADLARALETADRAVADAGLPAEARADYVASRARLPEPEALRAPTDETVRRAWRVAKAPRVDDVLVLPKKRPKEATAARAAVKDAYEVVAGALLDEISRVEIDAPLAGLLDAYHAALVREKRERGVLDFADLELSTLDLLEGFEARRRPLPGRPQELLVDEFQDVNPVQARILSHLATSGRGRRTDLFAVGDPKQSIYRFRGADVEVIERHWREVGDAGRHHLADSFRSRPELVALHNGLFGALFGPEAAGEDGVRYEPLVARAAFDRPTEPFPVEFTLVLASKTSGTTRSEAEAEAVALRVETWVRGGGAGGGEAGPACLTKRGRGGEATAPRPIGFGDVAILLRARGNLPVFERALTRRGIPFHTGRGRGFYETEEIRDLVHLLRVVLDPHDGFAVAAWLSSPSVGATDADLLAVFAGRPSDPLAVAAARPGLAAAVGTVRDLRRLAAGGRLEDVIRAALVRFDALPTALLQEGGARRAKNLEKALGIARRLDEAGGHGLLDFLRYLSDLKDRDVDEAEAAAGAPDDAVALLTIHAAKGLEWPCVIVADTNRKGGGRAAPPFHLDGNGAVAWRVRDVLDGVPRPSAGYAALADAETAAAERESNRLLYVALTRAEERLFVTASVEGRNKDGSPARLVGWGKTLFEAFGEDASPGDHRADVGGAPVDVHVIEYPADGGPSSPLPASDVAGPSAPAAPAAPSLPAGSSFPTGPLPPPGAGAADVDWLRTARARISAPPAHLRRTPFVVPISDLLLFAESPARYYDERVLGADPIARTRVPRLERDDPAAARRPDDAEPSGDDVPADRYDEGRETLDGVDRAALGRAVHLALERYAPGDDVARARAGLRRRGVPAGGGRRGRGGRARDGRPVPPLGDGDDADGGAARRTPRATRGRVPREDPLSRRGTGRAVPLAPREGDGRPLGARRRRADPRARPQDELAAGRARIARGARRALRHAAAPLRAGGGAGHGRGRRRGGAAAARSRVGAAGRPGRGRGGRLGRPVARDARPVPGLRGLGARGSVSDPVDRPPRVASRRSPPAPRSDSRASLPVP